MNRRNLLPAAALLLALPPAPVFAAPERTLSLAGEWRFRLDPHDAGIAEQWHQADLPGRIPLPGSTDEHRLGFRNDNVEPRRLTRAWEYTGPAWYQRDIDIPATWQGARLVLFLERCHWESQVWLDDRHIGLQNSLSTPHVHELGQAVTPGKHRLTIRVDNRMRINLGPWASGITEEGPGNWNGITGKIELRATDLVWIESLRVFAGPPGGTARVELIIRNLTGKAQDADLVLRASERGNPSNPFETRSRAGISARPQSRIEATLSLGAATRWWSDFEPALYDLAVSLGSAETHAVFGMREWSRRDTQFTLNGRVVLLRGNVDNGAFPLKGYPPMDVESWRERLRLYRDYGFNHVRFHSWCPPEAAFAAADELGLVFQVENPMWIGDGRISADAARTAFIRAEAERIVDAYGNHPSFCLMSMGNELGSGLDPFLGDLVEHLRRKDPRRFYTSTSAPDNILRPDDYFVSAGPRWQNLRGDPRLEKTRPGTAFDYREYLSGVDRPLLAHELGQWTVYPDFDEGRKYLGSQQPRYLEIYRRSAARNHVADQAADFQKASGALMVALYKEEIESILRTPGIAGFQLLALSDWPGFGPAFIGVLDALNDSRGLIAPERYRRFSNSVVPLLRMPKREWTRAETLSAQVQVAHYGAAEMKDARPSWVVRNQRGNAVASGEFPAVSLKPGGLRPAGVIRLALEKLEAPAQYSLELTIGALSNDWDFWVYPNRLADPAAAGVLVTGSWDETTRAALRDGRKVLFLAPSKNLANTVPTSFTTAFWSLLWFPKRPETMGVLCDPDHPALARFSTKFHSDWQWWDLMSQSRALILDGAPPAFRPIVQVIDDPNRNHRLGAVFEARAGKGRLLVSTFDLASSLDTRLAARQLRHSLLSYASSEKFHPPAELDWTLLETLFAGKDR